MNNGEEEGDMERLGEKEGLGERERKQKGGMCSLWG